MHDLVPASLLPHSPALPTLLLCYGHTELLVRRLFFVFFLFFLVTEMHLDCFIPASFAHVVCFVWKSFPCALLHCQASVCLQISASFKGHFFNEVFPQSYHSSSPADMSAPTVLFMGHCTLVLVFRNVSLEYFVPLKGTHICAIESSTLWQVQQHQFSKCLLNE
jgi:hypothetical protein